MLRPLRYVLGLRKVPFVQSVATFQAGSIAMTLIGFASSIVYARFLGVEQYGVYAVVSSFAGLVGIVGSFGQETTLVTFLAEAAGKRHEEEIHRVLRYFLQSSAVSSLTFVLLAIAAPALADMLQDDASIGTLSRILLMNSALQFAPVLAFLTLQLEHRVGLVALFENIRSLAQLLLATALLVLGLGVKGILLAGLTVSAAYVPLSLMLYRSSARALGFPSLCSLLQNILAGGTSTYIRQGLWIAMDRNVSTNIYPHLFFLVLNSTTSLQVVGFFRLALRLAQLPLQLLMPGITRVSAVTIPMIAGRDRRALKSACVKLLKGTMGLMVLAAICAALLVPPLLPYVYGAAFTPSVPAFLLLLPASILAALHVASVPLSRVFCRVWAMIFFNVTGIIGGLLTYIVLYRTIEPLIAIAVGVVIYQALSLLLYLDIFLLMHRTKRLV